MLNSAGSRRIHPPLTNRARGWRGRKALADYFCGGAAGLEVAGAWVAGGAVDAAGL